MMVSTLATLDLVSVYDIDDGFVRTKPHEKSRSISIYACIYTHKYAY
jgi:hypothetical protein